jgi:hypothetical protein
MLVSITTHALAYHNAQYTRDEVFREFLHAQLIEDVRTMATTRLLGHMGM